MRVVPFITAHLDNLKVHDYMDYANSHMTEQYGELLSSYPSYSYLVNGIVIACGGVVPVSEKRYIAWSLMSSETNRHMLGITREVTKFLETFDADRVELQVRADFSAGCRWAKMLGFICETPCPMKKFGDDGMDYYLYARVK